MKAFLEEVVEDFIRRYGWDGIGELGVVVPSRRAALAVKEYIVRHAEAAHLTNPIRLPQMMTLIELQNSLSTRYQADEVYLVTTLYRVYRDVMRESGAAVYTSLATFYAWGRQLVQDFSGIDKAYPLVQPDAFLCSTADARQLEQLDIDDEVRERLQDLISISVHRNITAGSKRAVFEQLWLHLDEIYHRFHDALGDRSYEGARMRNVLENWDSDYVQLRLKRRYIFAGFNFLVPAEQELMQRLKDTDRADFYWEYPTGFSANTHAFRWVTRNAERFGNRLTPQPWQPHKPVTIVSTASAHSQAQMVYTWLKEHHQSGHKSAVVIADEQVLEAVIYALPSGEEDIRFERINITKGFPIRRTTIFAEIDAWLHDKHNDVQSGETYREVLGRLADFVDEKLQELTQPVSERVDDEDQVPMSWHELLRGESLYQTRAALLKLADSLSEERMFDEITNLRTLRLIVRRYLEGLTFPFHGEPLTDIQVTGMLETRALDVDHLLVLNVEEGVVPNAVTDRSYIPFYLRKQYGLETHEEATDVYAYNFFRLITRAEDVTLVFTSAESKLNRSTMSRFLRQMMLSDDFSVTKQLLIESNTVNHAEPALFDPEKPNLLSLLHVSSDGQLCRENGNPLILSPSAMNTYLTCPMQFYLKYVRGLPEPVEEEPLYNRAELGSLTHETMLLLYEQPQQWNHAEADRVDKKIREAEKRLNEELGHVRFDTTKHPIETAVVKKYVARIIQADQKLSETGGLQLMALEQYCRLPLSTQYGNLFTGGRIDRVDRLNGLLRIVDYKTGKGHDERLQVKAMSEVFQQTNNPVYHLQTMLYAAAWIAEHPEYKDHMITPVIYFPGRKSDKVVHGLIINGEPVNYVTCGEEFMKGLTLLVEEILTNSRALATDNPQRAMQVEEGKCSGFCPFLNVCGRRANEYH